jgi:hypothetical protein
MKPAESVSPVEPAAPTMSIETASVVETVPESSSVVPSTSPPASPKTVTCRNCSFENESEVNFCRNCAKPLRSAGSKDDVVMIFDTTQVKD